MVPLKYVVGLAPRFSHRPCFRAFATGSDTAVCSDPRSADLSAGLPPLPDIPDEKLRARVFTHRSLFMRSNMLFQDPEDDPSPDNERLEFLGDTVLAVCTATLLEQLNPRLRVGPTSKVKSLIVSNENLATICKYYQLQGRLRCAANQQMTLQNSTLIQANLLESYIGGVYLNQGFVETRDWLLQVLTPYAKAALDVVKEEHLLGSPSQPEDGEINDGHRPQSPPVGSVVDPGTLSYFNQWLSQNKKNANVDWQFAEIAGTKATPLWSAVVSIDGQKLGEGISTGKKGAKTEAAKRAMQVLGIHTGL